MIYINNGDLHRTRRARGKHERVCIIKVVNRAQHGQKTKTGE